METKGQTTLEGVVLLTLVVLAFLTMYNYFKEAIQGNLKSNLDSFSDEQQVDTGSSMILDPGTKVGYALYDGGGTGLSKKAKDLTKLHIVNPTITAKRVDNGKETGTYNSYNIVNQAGNIIQIDGWGRYE